MLRTTSRTLATVLAVVLLLAAAAPASAQKAKSSNRRSKPSATHVASSAKVKRVAPPRSRSVRTTAGTVKSRSAARPTAARQTVRVKRVPTPRERSRNSMRSAFSSKRTVSELKGTARARTRDVDRERYADMFRRRPADRPNGRPADDGRNRRPRDSNRRGYNGGHGGGYDSGYAYGYRRGYRHGYHGGYAHGHYYGPYRVFGYNYGGFGFYNGRWHFAIVIGGPVAAQYRYGRYRYNWWDGYGASLVTWDRAMEVYPASYTFDLSGRSCVELWIRTTDGTDYEIKVDPRYYDARDPGDLYAALWSQLEREGQLQLEDVNGAVLIFPAGMIQQIEARACS